MHRYTKCSFQKKNSLLIRRLIQPMIERIWQKRGVTNALLLPFSWAFTLIAVLRRKLLTALVQYHSPVPVIVVGNLSVGGSGKTPCLISICNYLSKQGLKPGIISRGYGGLEQSTPMFVNKDSLCTHSGDEPLMIARRTNSPVVVSTDRVAAIKFLLEHHQCDVILSDDGLQHYAMHRDIEVVVCQSPRSLGNGLCMPAGPLREPLSRLQQVDFVLGDIDIPAVKHDARVSFVSLVHLQSGQRYPFDYLADKEVVAIAGIAHPERFFLMLSRQGINHTQNVFPDHHVFDVNDVKGLEDSVIVMTEKDAVKCENLALDKAFYVSIELVIDEVVLGSLYQKVAAAKTKQGVVCR